MSFLEKLKVKVENTNTPASENNEEENEEKKKVSVAWLFIRTTYVLDDIVLSRYKIDEKDNLQARKIYTQLQVFKRVVIDHLRGV